MYIVVVYISYARYRREMGYGATDRRKSMRNFDTLLAELATARSNYEELKDRGASFAERLDARATLHELRVQMGPVRRHHTARS